MTKSKIFLTLTGYQLTWFACVFGENKFNEPLLGVYVGGIYLLIYFYFSKNKTKFIKISLSISIPGYIFDTLMVFFSIYKFNSSFILGTLPFWMIILWLSFSTLFDEILLFFKNYKILGIIISGSIAPITYYAGQPLGIININNIILFFMLMVSFWSLLMLYYLKYLIKKN